MPDINGFSRTQKAYLYKLGFNPSEWKLITDYPFFLQIENLETGERKVIEKYQKGMKK